VILPEAEFARWVLASARSGLLAVDRAGRLQALSPAALRILELDDPGRPGVEARPLLASRPAIWALLEEGLRGVDRPGRAELEIQTASGERRNVGYTLVTVTDASGLPAGAALWFRDLTPFERADEQERLRDRLAALGQMAAGLAHEIRNPLASLEIVAGLLKRSPDLSADAMELVEDLLAELRSVSGIVNASLGFVRPEVPARRRLPPRPLLEEALRLARARVHFSGVVDLRCEDGLRLFVDRDALRRALVDLISNAFEAMAEQPHPSGNTLTLGLRRDPLGGGAEISIADTGPGISPELRERVIYPFFTTRERGSGVGLAEVQKVVAGHSGSIELRDAPEGGAHFVLRLPGEPAE
jgi:signal transduction histidine kinase